MSRVVGSLRQVLVLLEFTYSSVCAVKYAVCLSAQRLSRASYGPGSDPRSASRESAGSCSLPLRHTERMTEQKGPQTHSVFALHLLTYSTKIFSLSSSAL